MSRGQARRETNRGVREPVAVVVRQNEDRREPAAAAARRAVGRRGDEEIAVRRETKLAHVASRLNALRERGEVAEVVRAESDRQAQEL